MNPTKKATYQVMPDLCDEEYQALKADIDFRGVLVAVELDEEGNILDGFHRVKACKALGIKDYPTIVRLGMTDEEKRTHARKLNIARRHLNQTQKRLLVEEQLQDTSEISDRRIATMLAVSPTTVGQIRKEMEQKGVLSRLDTTVGKDGIEQPRKKEKKKKRGRKKKPVAIFSQGSKQTSIVFDTLEKATEKQAHQILTGEKTLDRVARDLKSEEHRVKRLAMVNELRTKSITPLNQMGRFPIVYADPPWRYEHGISKSRQIEDHYPTMSIEEICDLPVSEIVLDDCILFLWSPAAKLEEAIWVINSWGFEYRTCMIWMKMFPGLDHLRLQIQEVGRQDRIAYLYKSGCTISETADIIGISESRVQYQLHKQGIVRERREKSYNRAILSDRQLEVLDGEMLGDGGIYMGKNNKNARLQWNLKYRGHVDILMEEFAELRPSCHRRKDRDGWRLWTSASKDITLQHSRWYGLGKKAIPDDLVLSPVSCFHWYIGDGYLRPHRGIELYTFDFTEIEVDRLGSMLKQLGVEAVTKFKKNSGNGYYLTLKKPQAAKFLSYIGPCRVTDYAYKWGKETDVVLGRPQWGMGYYVRRQDELLLIARRGTLPLPKPKNRPLSAVYAPRGEHSKKPDIFYDIIEAMYPDLDKIELFARRPRRGWTSWGYEANGD